MAESPRQVVVESPLLEFLKYCEVYCTASCCGRAAFEIHKALILSREAQENRAERNGDEQFVQAWHQVRDLNVFLQGVILEGKHLESVHDEVPVWSKDSELPLFHLPQKDILDLFENLEKVFFGAAKYNGLSGKLTPNHSAKLLK
jgi:hypothetical protein